MFCGQKIVFKNFMQLCVLSNSQQLLFFLKNLFFQTFFQSLWWESVLGHVLYIRYLYPWYILHMLYMMYWVSRSIYWLPCPWYIFHMLCMTIRLRQGVSDRDMQFYILNTYSVIYIAHVIHHNATGHIVLYIGYLLRDIYCTLHVTYENQFVLQTVADHIIQGGIGSPRSFTV